VLLTPVLVLFLGACSGSLSPEDVVDLYLSETRQRETEAAIKRWELSEVGAVFVVLDPEQQRVRMDGRRILATELTEALGIPGPRLMWEQVEAAYYDVRNGVPLAIESHTKADLATVEIRLMIERVGKARLEERAAFNLWKSPDSGWRITGLDKGLLVLEPFLDEVRASQ
jgi:ABC-type oligopeptide transport system substrate-binding subunit